MISEWKSYVVGNFFSSERHKLLCYEYFAPQLNGTINSLARQKNRLDSTIHCLWIHSVISRSNTRMEQTKLLWWTEGQTRIIFHTMHMNPSWSALKPFTVVLRQLLSIISMIYLGYEPALVHGWIAYYSYFLRSECFEHMSLQIQVYIQVPHEFCFDRSTSFENCSVFKPSLISSTLFAFIQNIVNLKHLEKNCAYAQDGRN